MGSGTSSNIKPILRDTPSPRKNGALSAPTSMKTTSWISTNAGGEVPPSPIGTLSRQPSQTPICGPDRLVRPTSCSLPTAGRPRSEPAGDDPVHSYKSQLGESRQIIFKLQSRVTELENQMGTLESENMDLAEQLQAVEEQLEEQHRRSIAAAPTQCTKTVAAKDQYIQKLEKETKLIQDEITKLKTKYKKKLRHVHSQLAEAKHESSLRVFESNDEVSKLKEENDTLIEKLKSLTVTRVESPGQAEPDVGPVPDQSATSTNDRTALVLELSGRVSEQENRIVDLEMKLKQRDETIEALRTCKSRTGSASSCRSGSANRHCNKLSPDDPHGGPVSLSEYTDYDQWSVDQHTSALDQPTATERWAATQPPHTDISDMKNIAREMKQFQKKKKKKNKSLSDRRCVLGSSGADYRESSSTSRDSGVASLEVDDSGQSTYDRGRAATSQTSDRSEEGRDEPHTAVKTLTTSGHFLEKGDRANSAKSHVSQWSEDSELENDIDSSNVSVSGIRRISAPKKKKKHALSEHDRIVEGLLQDLNEPLVPSKPPKYVTASGR